MGICESNDTGKNSFIEKRKSQPFHAPIYYKTSTFNNNLSFLSQASIISHKQSKPILYKYRSTYGKNDDQTTLMTESLYNSLYSGSKTLNNFESIDETLNESSSQVYEIISDGKMDEDKVKQSTDKTTIDNYIEYIGNNSQDIKKSKVDIYNNKKQKKI